MKKDITKSIWVADDDDDDRMLIKEAFEESAYKEPLVFFENGEKVIDMLKTKAQYKPSLILLDLNMPKVSGHDVLYFIKKNKKTKDIPVIILTTSKSKKDQETALKMGADGFITKPHQFIEMLRIAENLVKHYG